MSRFAIYVAGLIDGRTIVMSIGTNTNPYYKFYKSEDHVFKIYVDNIGDFIDEHDVEEIYICNINVKKLFSFTGISYEMHQSKNLDKKTIDSLRKKIDRKNIKVIYDKALTSKFRSFVRWLDNELAPDKT